MRCFNHHDAEAVGTCKVCQKGLCPLCAADLGHSIACSGKHEPQAEAIDKLVSRNMSLQGAAGKSRYVAPLFYGFMGALFLLTGLREDTGNTFSVIMGLGFLVFAVAVFFGNQKAYGGAERDGK